MKIEPAAVRNMMLAYGITIEQAGEIVKQSKIVLNAVRSMYWRTKFDAEDLKEEATGKLSIDIGAALLYLSDLAPLKEQKDYEQRIMRMFENQSIIGAFEKKLEAIRHYPDNGKLYHAILKSYYFDEHRCSDQDIFEELNLERTVYYQRKREAVLLFGLQIKAHGLASTNGRKSRASKKK